MNIVQWEKQNDIAVITMCNEANRQNMVFAEQMIQCLDKIIEDKTIYSMVLTSSDEKIDSREFLNAVLCILSYSDGCHSILDISLKCEISLDLLVNAVLVLEEKGLLESLGSKGVNK